MINITKMNNQPILLNNDLIETIEETPDTVITLTTGKKLIVKESVDDILEKIIAFRIQINQMQY
ncbi:MAG: flagellar FlbD family protein, partial [Vallitaleaceae bacterium]|nr:flagellar FlbD family protein [Vallitaleaceae bacterium]